ncbi:hypothetical protein CTEN210_08617 [Chaetoceros tenuissimus]|uniref:Transmembrane protein n=1 Tax=Chaetoceros tenuissimus TaxID=426638 RepID=A0AAD3H6K5_9STRA|nr:hypothetical protein CTEN210_08617 [Chaetoceros tenuissimus]
MTFRAPLFIFVALALCCGALGFTTMSQLEHKTVGASLNQNKFRYSTRISATEEEGEEKKMTLEEKMASWEASEEELKAASLGGLTPSKADGFDIGLYIAFPIIVATSLLFAVFPFIMDKIDVTSVGPPPTV